MEVIRLYYYQGYFSFSVLFLFFLSTVERLLNGTFFFRGWFQGWLVDKINQRRTKLGQKMKAFLSVLFRAKKPYFIVFFLSF